MRGELTRLASRSRLIANSRLAVFLVAAGVAIAVAISKLPTSALWGVVGLVAAYIVLALTHRKNDTEEARAGAALAYDERVIARSTLAWQSFPHDGARFLDAAHMYTTDLDVFGPGSLFQKLNETGTKLGEETLARWLSAPADATVIAERQAAVRELATRVDFRRALVVESQARGDDKIDPARFAAWSTRGPRIDSARWTRWFPIVTVPALIVTYLLSRDGIVPPVMPFALLFVQILLAGLVKGRMQQFFEALAGADRGIDRLRATFAQLEAEKFDTPVLQSLARGTEGKASAALRKLDFWYGFAEARRSQFGPVLNAIFLWDIVFLFRIDAWRERFGGQVDAWLAALGDVEALASLGGFAHETASVFPELVDGEPRVVAADIAHPLLAGGVANDVAIRGNGHALLLTGSNMSGKSTLLRAIGANVVLGLAGAPVCASSFELTVLHVATSMRVADSLTRGMSYFYAEVKRLKAVLDVAVAHPGACLFLLDEILLGTNTRERQIASREIILSLLDTGALGGVTTHDLALTALESEAPGRVVNAHFRDHVADGQMTFDYKLRPGVVDTTNALRVLELAGITLRGDSQHPVQ